MPAPGLSGWTDHHCHLDAADAAALVAEAIAGDVTRLVNVGTDVAGSRTAIEVASRFDEVFATAGVHPHDASGGIEGLEGLLGSPEVVAVGECGLDHHYMHSPAAAQREVFAAQIALAHAHDLPVVIHTREAWDETFEILEAEGVPARLVFHCFTGGPSEARRCLDLGALVSFSGIVTFPSAGDLRDAARICPLDRILVETDAPYLAPVPHRGRPNRPALVAVVGSALAEVVGVDAAALAQQTTSNAEMLYRFGARR
ncbi:MAG TPA: TatD family hydrolase [Microthrixaceae bacterium]|nr:TatD family hydrolase [Microthrixaceae bacterium]